MPSSGGYGGILLSTGEKDYYVFYAHKGTVLSATLNDAQNPACLACDGLTASLHNSAARTVAYTPTSATVVTGIPVPGSFSVTLRRAGTYYLIVSGVLTRDSNGNPIPLPYNFQLNGTPNVQWPPPCTVPALRRPTSLARAEHLIASAHCSVGKVSHQHSGHLRRGDVIALRPASGTSLASGAPVAIVVSSGRGHKRPASRRQARRHHHRRGHKR